MQLRKQFLISLLTSVLFCSLATVVLSNSVNTDSCASLRFHSEIEKQGFTDLCSGRKPDYLSMAVAVNPASGTRELNSIREKIKTETAILKIKSQELKKPAKMLRFVFDHVQKTFLKEYDLDAGFTEMFESGKYNCLTATLLYSFLLDDLAVKHTIKFMPGHVYLIAYADDVPYIFETTDPIAGFMELNKAVQRNAVQSLRLIQLISSDNSDKKPTSDVFDRYYIKLNNTELRGLVGYQYTNQAFVSILKKDYISAYYIIAKGIQLTPMDELANMQEELLRQAIGQANKASAKMAQLLVIYYNTSTDENKKNQVADAFKQSVYQCLFTSFPSPDSLLPMYQILHAGITDQDLQKVLEDIYTSQYITFLETERDPSEVFTFLYDTYIQGNKNAFIRNHMERSIYQLTEHIHVSSEGVRCYDTITKHYPALMDFDLFRNNRCNILVNCAAEAFRNNNFTDGEFLLNKFDKEGYFKQEHESICNPAFVYSLAVSCYFKSGNISKAKAALAKGLTYDPDNWELKEKRREMK